MDITPFINTLGMGGLGYITGIVLKTNPKLMGITWLVGEAAIQVIKQIEAFEKYKIEHHFRLVIGSIACAYLTNKHCISKLYHTIGSLLTFCILPDLLAHSGISFVIGKK